MSIYRRTTLRSPLSSLQSAAPHTKPWKRRERMPRMPRISDSDSDSGWGKHVNIQIKSAIECASKCHRILHSNLWLPAIQKKASLLHYTWHSAKLEEQQEEVNPFSLPAASPLALFVGLLCCWCWWHSDTVHWELTQNSCQMPRHKAKWGSVSKKKKRIHCI